jgi:hypothetical protein
VYVELRNSYFAIEEVFIAAIPKDLKEIEGKLIFIKKGVDVRREVVLLDPHNCIIFSKYNELLQKSDSLYVTPQPQQLTSPLEMPEEEMLRLLEEIESDPNLMQDGVIVREEVIINQAIDLDEFKDFYEEI